MNYAKAASNELTRTSLTDKQKLKDKPGLPIRPSADTKGKNIRLYSNFFEVKSLPVGEIFQYDVKVQPKVLRNMNRAILNQAEKVYRDNKFGGFLLAYDGQSIMYSLRKLKDDKTVLEVLLPSSRPNKAEHKFQLTLTRVSSVNFR